MEPGVLTIFQGAGARVDLGHALRQAVRVRVLFGVRPRDSRCSYRALAHGRNGTASGFIPAGDVAKKRVVLGRPGTGQIGLAVRPARRGREAGSVCRLPCAERSGAGTLIQFCARTGADMTSAARTKAPADFTAPSIAPLAKRGRSIPPAYRPVPLPVLPVASCRAALSGPPTPRG